MQSWKRLELFIANFLNWKRETKSHYGNSIHDLSGDGYKGEAKHYKKFRIHTIKKKTDQLYKDDVIIFTKEKNTHYEPFNICATMSLNVFKYLIECKRIAEKLPDKTTKNNKYLVNDLKFQINICKSALTKLSKIIKELENER